MNKQPEDWLDDVPENENEDDDEIIWVSKSEIKRDAEALKDLGPKWSIWAKRAGPHSVGRRSACRHRAGAKDQERGPPPSAAADRQDAARPRYRADPDRARQAENRHNQQVSLFHNWKRCATAWWKKAMTSFRLSWICIRPPIANSCVHWCATRRKRRPPTSRLRLTARSSNTCASWPKRPTKRRRHPGMKPFHPR